MSRSARATETTILNDIFISNKIYDDLIKQANGGTKPLPYYEMDCLTKAQKLPADVLTPELLRQFSLLSLQKQKQEANMYYCFRDLQNKRMQILALAQTCFLKKPLCFDVLHLISHYLSGGTHSHKVVSVYYAIMRERVSEKEQAMKKVLPFLVASPDFLKEMISLSYYPERVFAWSTQFHSELKVIYENISEKSRLQQFVNFPDIPERIKAVEILFKNKLELTSDAITATACVKQSPNLFAICVYNLDLSKILTKPNIDTLSDIFSNHGYLDTALDFYHFVLYRFAKENRLTQERFDEFNQMTPMLLETDDSIESLLSRSYFRIMIDVLMMPENWMLLVGCQGKKFDIILAAFHNLRDIRSDQLAPITQCVMHHSKHFIFSLVAACRRLDFGDHLVEAVTVAATFEDPDEFLDMASYFLKQQVFIENGFIQSNIIEALKQNNLFYKIIHPIFVMCFWNSEDCPFFSVNYKTRVADNLQKIFSLSPSDLPSVYERFQSNSQLSKLMQDEFDDIVMPYLQLSSTLTL